MAEIELPLAVYCPHCGAYILVVGEEDLACDCCGGEFEIGGPSHA